MLLINPGWRRTVAHAPIGVPGRPVMGVGASGAARSSACCDASPNRHAIPGYRPPTAAWTLNHDNDPSLTMNHDHGGCASTPVGHGGRTSTRHRARPRPPSLSGDDDGATERRGPADPNTAAPDWRDDDDADALWSLRARSPSSLA